MFKLGLWSALVFFEHGSEMQLAAALVINVLQLCIHIEIKPMGGEDAALLNRMQTCTLVLTTYINFGALSMNYLKVSQTLAHFVDPGSVDEYDASIAAIGLLMELLTFGLFLSFGGVAMKKGFVKAQAADLKRVKEISLTLFGASSTAARASLPLGDKALLSFRGVGIDEVASLEPTRAQLSDAEAEQLAALPMHCSDSLALLYITRTAAAYASYGEEQPSARRLTHGGALCATFETRASHAL